VYPAGVISASMSLAIRRLVVVLAIVAILGLAAVAGGEAWRTSRLPRDTHTYP
jgi:hypothetical protein